MEQLGKCHKILRRGGNPAMYRYPIEGGTIVVQTPTVVFVRTFCVLLLFHSRRFLL